MFLPDKPEMVVQTFAVDQMKKELAPISKAAKQEEMNRPSLDHASGGLRTSQEA
ncbi:MAG: hypothetical protein LAO18_04490 [Acidobacteriia bacterium]|nr:hypothetical protein [Terriglobia bacterium]